MHLNIAICDDCTEEAEAVRAMCGLWAGETERRAEVTCFSSAESFLFDCDGSNRFDILLLDIEMKDISGIDLAKRVRRTDKRAQIVFITSHFELMGEGYEVDARHFLVKPVKQEKLFEVLNRAAEHLAVEPPSLIVKTEGEAVKLTVDEILYVESFLHYICIHTRSGEVRVKESISAFAERLGTDFFRIHRSYLVSLSRIERISRTQVTLEGGIPLPLSRGLYDEINRAFIQHN